MWFTCISVIIVKTIGSSVGGGVGGSVGGGVGGGVEVVKISEKVLQVQNKYIINNNL